MFSFFKREDIGKVEGKKVGISYGFPFKGIYRDIIREIPGNGSKKVGHSPVSFRRPGVAVDNEVQAFTPKPKPQLLSAFGWPHEVGIPYGFPL